ncbi:hypothetical protein DFP72DRAFT_1146703, partial [Ephemerocybe angulata]
MPAPLRSLPPQTKKRKLAHTSSVVSEIKQLEDELSSAIKSNASLNKVADLLELIVGPRGEALQPQELSKGIYSLYRVFTLVIASGKLSIQGEGAAKAVKAWLWERLNGYTDFLVLLMKDEEKVIRVSALQILFSLQKHLSSAQTAATDGASTSRPEFHLSHFRKVVSGLLLCPSRSASSDGVIDADVLDTFYETWFSVYDDIRWFFLRESVGILEKAPATASKNLLSILERLNTFPTDKEELNSWWVAELGAKPPKPKKTSANEDSDDDDEPTPNAEEEDDWRKFFDEPAPTDSKKAPSARLHKLTVHQSLHTLASHRAVFTRAWLGLLPRLTDASAAVRALNVMHRGVLPHLTRAVLVMDWIAGWVDGGGSVGLLA